MQTGNGTVYSNVASPNQQQQASGRAIFWALATVVLNAMLQPSFTGHLWSESLFEESLWPHRSSPFVCLMDAAADLWLIRDKHRNPALYPVSDSTYAKSTTVAMRLAIFVLGVLPQAIKVFSMRGILLTQIITALFFLATMVSMSRTLYLQSPYEDFRILTDRHVVKRPESSPRKMTWFDVPRVSGLIPHVTAAFYVWTHIGKHAGIVVPDDFNPVLCHIGRVGREALNTAVIIYIAQHFAIVLIRGKWWVPRTSLCGIFIFADPTGIARSLLRSGEESPSDWKAYFTFRMMFTLAVCSYGIAYVLEFCARILLKSLRQANTSARPRSLLPTSAIDHTADAVGSIDRPNSVTVSSTTTLPAPVASTELTASQGNQPPPYIDVAAPDSTNASLEAAGIDSGEPPPPYSTVTELETTRPSPGAVQNASPGEHSEMTISQTNVPDTPVAPRDNTTATTSNESQNSPAASQDLNTSTHWSFEIFIWLIVGPVIFFYSFIMVLQLAMRYAGLPWPGDEHDEQHQQQDAAEQGSAAPQARPSDPPQERPVGRTESYLSKLVDQASRLLVKIFLVILWRLVKAFMSLFLYPVNYMEAQMKRHSKDRVWVAFGVFNLATAMLYYLTVYKAEGTYSPAWTSILG